MGIDFNTHTFFFGTNNSSSIKYINVFEQILIIRNT